MGTCRTALDPGNPAGCTFTVARIGSSGGLASTVDGFGSVDPRCAIGVRTLDSVEMNLWLVANPNPKANSRPTATAAAETRRCEFCGALAGGIDVLLFTRSSLMADHSVSAFDHVCAS